MMFQKTLSLVGGISGHGNEIRFPSTACTSIVRTAKKKHKMHMSMVSEKKDAGKKWIQKSRTFKIATKTNWLVEHKYYKLLKSHYKMVVERLQPNDSWTEFKWLHIFFPRAYHHLIFNQAKWHNSVEFLFFSDSFSFPVSHTAIAVFSVHIAREMYFAKIAKKNVEKS